MGVQTVLLYGCESIFINKGNLRQLCSTQGNLIKSMLGVRRSSYTTPLLKALKIKDIATYINTQSANLLRSCLLYESNASLFYANLMAEQYHTKHANTLLYRCSSYFARQNVSILKYVLDDNYKADVLRNVPNDPDGLVDTIRYLCANYDSENRDFLQGLIASF